MKLLRSGLFGAAVLAVALPFLAHAQDLPQRKELKRVDLSGAQNMEVVSSVSTFKAGDEFPRHLHHGVEAGIATADTSRVDVVLFVDQKITNTQAKDPRVDRSRMKMSLVSDAGTWKIDSLTLL